MGYGSDGLSWKWVERVSIKSIMVNQSIKFFRGGHVIVASSPFHLTCSLPFLSYIHMPISPPMYAGYSTHNSKSSTSPAHGTPLINIQAAEIFAPRTAYAAAWLIFACGWSWKIAIRQPGSPKTVISPIATARRPLDSSEPGLARIPRARGWW